MSKIVTGVLVAVLGVSLSSPASARVEPKNPSDLVFLRASSDSVACPYDGAKLVVDERVTSDGIGLPWGGPPPGKVLVINHVRLWTNAPPGGSYTFLLSQPQTVLLIERVNVDAGGTAILDVEVPTGIAVRPGVTLCANTGNIAIHGYLANDK